MGNIVAYELGRKEKPVEGHDSTVADFTERVFLEVNARRMSAGKQPLHRNQYLYNAAAVQAACWMGQVALRDPETLARKMKWDGEAIGCLQGSDSIETLEITDRWIKDAASKAVILGDWTHCGIAVGGSFLNLFVCVFFGHRQAVGVPELHPDITGWAMRDGLNFIDPSWLDD